MTSATLSFPRQLRPSLQPALIASRSRSMHPGVRGPQPASPSLKESPAEGPEGLGSEGATQAMQSI